jgi:hypothetical protein
MPRRVGVVIPTHNRPVERVHAVRSVLAQEEVEVDIYLVDDGETCGAIEFDDPRVHVLATPKPGSGEAAARNTGIAAVDTEWIAFCDDDDVWHPRKLATQLDRCGDAGWIACGAVVFRLDRSGLPRAISVTAPITAEALEARLRRRGGIPGGNTGAIARTELVRSTGGYRDLVIGADWDMFLRLSDLSPVAIVPERLVGIRAHEGSVTADARRLEDAMYDVASLHDGSDGTQPVEPDVEGFMVWYAQVACQAGQGTVARDFQMRAARLSGRKRDELLAIAMRFAPRTVDLARTVGRRSRLPRSERVELERWLEEVLAAQV